MNQRALLFLFFFCLGISAFSQKKIAILGSSTAFGNGASPIDSSWVNTLQANFRKNTIDAVDTVITNLAVAGYVTYQSMPSNFTPPTGRPAPDPNHNVTYVLNNVKPDIVIISYPTNDIVNGYDPKEEMDNLRLMFQQFNANNIFCYIATSQPRSSSTNDSTRNLLRHLVDSIKINFGNYAINFWDDLVTNDGNNNLKDEVNSGDGIHPNNLGHRYLFQRVVAKNIFTPTSSAPLPLSLTNFQVQIQNSVAVLKWSTVSEEPNTSFEIQRSSDGQNFQSLFIKNANGAGQYSWNDNQPLQGKSFYRLKIIEPTKKSFSKVITVLNNGKQATIANLYADASNLHLQINSDHKQNVLISIINFGGAVVQKQTLTLSSSNNDFMLPIGNLTSGAYVLNMTASDGTTEVHRFSKMK